MDDLVESLNMVPESAQGPTEILNPQETPNPIQAHTGHVLINKALDEPVEELHEGLEDYVFPERKSWVKAGK